MKEYSSKDEFITALKGSLMFSDDKISVVDREKLVQKDIDELVWNAVFSASEEVRNLAKYVIRYIAYLFGLGPYSIQEIYEARGRGEFSGVTVPAINIRGLAYDVARSVFRAAKKDNVGLLILEIARSEISYTNQPPSEYSVVILGAAIKEGYNYPIFLQGDHFQVSGSKFKKDPDAELNAVKKLIRDAISAGFFNIDIDTSTLVDLSKQTVVEQQQKNSEICSHLLEFVRKNQPQGVNIAIGGEIGEIGGKNSTEEELRAFLDNLEKIRQVEKGVIKVAVQTGTTHGGVVMPDGSIAKVKLDFDTLQRLGKVAQSEYKLAGCVQHGASTLPPELFDKFPQVETAEIHLATEFQNMIYDHPLFPKELKDEINNWLFKNCADERKEGDTDQQFLYKTRKKAFGPFKREIWNLEQSVRDEISKSLEEKFSFLFKKLNVCNTINLVNRYLTKNSIQPKCISIVEGEIGPVEKGAAD